MATGPLVEPERGTGAPGVDRRDPTTRVLRSAVAAWFSLHPARLAALDRETVERMALRLEGRTLRLIPQVARGPREPPAGHPWAG